MRLGSFIRAHSGAVSARPTYAAAARRAPSSSNPHARRESGRCGRRRESRRRRRRARSANASPSDLITTSCLPSSSSTTQRHAARPSSSMTTTVASHGSGTAPAMPNSSPSVHQRHQRVAHLHHARRALHRVHLLRLRPQRFADARTSASRTARAPTPTIRPSTIASVSGRRDGERRALAGLGLDLDPAAQRLDVAADDVHADAAAGDLGDLLRGREAGLEDQLVDLVRRRRARPAAISPRSTALRAGSSRCSGRAVVGDLDDDVAALVIGAERQAACGRLPAALRASAAARCRGRRCCAPCASADR